MASISNEQRAKQLERGFAARLEYKKREFIESQEKMRMNLEFEHRAVSKDLEREYCKDLFNFEKQFEYLVHVDFQKKCRTEEREREKLFRQWDLEKQMHKQQILQAQQRKQQVRHDEELRNLQMQNKFQMMQNIKIQDNIRQDFQEKLQKAEVRIRELENKMRQ